MLHVPIQADLFGGPNHIPGFHVVSAHSRVQADGNEVFVAEHVRLNRGRSAVPRGPRASASPGDSGDGQIDLFASPSGGRTEGR